MYGMPIAQAIFFAAIVIGMVVAVRRWRLHPFLPILVVGAAVGWSTGKNSNGLVARTFETGFSQAVYGPGLVIVAAGFVAGLAESAGAYAWIGAAIARHRWLLSTRLATLFGLVAGIGSSPASAFAILLPFLRATDDAALPRREVPATALALAISASHGLP